MRGYTGKCRGEMPRKDNLNPPLSVVGSELALAAPEETRRSFHGRSHESCLSPYAALAEAGQCGVYLHPQSDAGLGSRGSAPRASTTQPSRCLHCSHDHRPSSPDSAKPEQAQEWGDSLPASALLHPWEQVLALQGRCPALTAC